MAALKWDLDEVVKVLEREVVARECTATTGTLPQVLLRKSQPRIPTGAALLINNSGSDSDGPTCVYCGQDHTSTSCSTFTDVSAHKEVLHKAVRCYICLRKNHLSRKCRASSNRQGCEGRHHSSICPGRNLDQTPRRLQGPIGSTAAKASSSQSSFSTNTLYVGAQTSVLRQTAKVQLINPSSTTSIVVARAIMNSGSQ